jgi:nitrite reductase/ring-hydroxylating ferredoxin subunit
VKVARVSEIPAGGMKMVTLGIEEVLIANVEGKFHAIGNACTHVGGPLAEGELSGKVVTCPWHGSQFNVTDGRVVGPPARLPEPVYELTVQGDDIMIRKK